jgi:hypothetical protein
MRLHSSQITGSLTVSSSITFGTSLSDGTIAITAFADEDGMGSNSATLIPTQQSVKAYVDAQVTAQDFDATTDSGTIDIDLDSETLTVAGGAGIDTSATGTTITIAGEAASVTNAGIVEIATAAETNTGTDATRAVSPDALEDWEGSAQVTTLGTISSGTWEGTTVAAAQGGTGATSLSDLITLTTHTTGNYVGTITGGTNLTSTAATSGEGTTHTLNVDDSFLVNDASDTTSGTITAGGFTTTGNISGSISQAIQTGITTAANLTTVGTIGTGTWQGTTIAINQGGTGATSLADLITLTTHTTGNYVKKVTVGTGLGGAVDSEGGTAAMTLDAAQTQITSLLATDIKIGEDNETKIDFETADEIHFYAANTEQVYVGDNILGPQTDSDVDLGSTGVRWKDAYVDSITVTGDATVAGTVTAQEFHTEFVSSSILYTSGSTRFGNTSDDIHQFTGSVHLTNSGSVSGSATSTGSFGRLEGSTLQGTIVTPSQTNITSVGTIGTGTWQGTTVAVDQGGTGVTTKTGTGNVVLSSSPTIVTPTIASFTNSTHTHANAAGGGQITLGTGTTGNYVATAVAGDGIDVSGATGNVTITAETSTAANLGAVIVAGGTNATVGYSGGTATVNVDDAFLKNDASDTTSGTITAAGLVTAATGSIAYGAFSDKVGIGTASPGVELDISGSGDQQIRIGSSTARAQLQFNGVKTTNAEFAELSFANAGDSVAGIQVHRQGANDQASMQFLTQAAGGSVATRMTISGSGNVGIGTTSPDYKLQVDGDIAPETTNTYDLGAPSLRWANIYTSDLHLKNEVGDWTVEEGENDLFITNNKTGKKFKFKLEEVT